MRKKGFTLIELMIGVVIGIIILLMVGMVSSISTKFWKKGETKSMLNSTLLLISSFLEKNIREATSCEVFDNGRGIILKKEVSEEGDEWERKFYLRGNNLMYENEDGKVITLVKGEVKGIEFKKFEFKFPAEDYQGEEVSACVSIEIEIEKNGETLGIKKIVNLRNMGVR
ncbi:MAG: hypothetical protein DRP67_03225 [Candidatus Omnitrophota bacterium]|nr:MAG: hypothetical protein DRP67_03225 [Candidatus Omnitrophota bacterium]